MMLAVLAVVAVAGWATVAVTDRDEGLQVGVFVVVTILTMAALALIGRRPWIYVSPMGLTATREPEPLSVRRS